MTKQYVEWIDNWLKTNSACGQCAKATLEMQQQFPELTRVRGHFDGLLCGERQHWWLTTPDGRIVDPTRTQFRGPGDYIPWMEGDEEPVGECMNCGKLSFYHAHACSKECSAVLEADFS